MTMKQIWKYVSYFSELKNLTFVYNNSIEEFFRAGIWCLKNKKGEGNVSIVIKIVFTITTIILNQFTAF